MRIFVEGVGLLGPGLNGWQASRPVLSGGEAYVSMPAVIVASDRLPPAERRRTGIPVKLALAVGFEAFTNAERDAAATATVFTSSSGDGEILHQICETLASAERQISPTRFHNSVHNAAAGYWSIAARSQEPSTSLCCYDASFAAGLFEAAAQVVVNGVAVALIAYDQPYPEPLRALRPVGANFGMALVLAPQPSGRTFASMEVTLVADEARPTCMSDAGLEKVRASIPAARSLPLLSALGRGATEVVVLDYVAGNRLRVAVAPCQ